MRKWGCGVLALLMVLLAASFADAARATLDWTDMASNEDGFYIQRKPGLCTAAGTWAFLAGVGPNVVTYADLTVAEGQAYAYRVDAYNSAGESAWSNCADITIAVSIPIQPTGLALSLLNGRVVVTWADLAVNETGYNLERKAEACSGTGAFSPLVSLPANSTTYTDGAVVEGRRYCYRVAASNSAGQSAWSNTGDILVPFTIPAAPVQLRVTGGQ